jgi:hypothetical protein
MNEFNWLQRLAGVFLALLPSKTMTVWVKEDGEMVQKRVKNPISFSELDEMFGEDNWSL